MRGPAMTATLPNRVADYFTPTRLDVPPTSEGRQELWTTAVFQAVALLQAKLASRDPDVAMEAARLLLDLEKTRMRHARDLTGTPEKKPAAAPPLSFGAPLPPLEPLDPVLPSVRDEWDDED